MDAKYNLWIEKNQTVVLSSWRVGLLRAIGDTGSIAGGAKTMNVSERTARQKVREIETGLGFKVLEPDPAGTGRKPWRLTARGRKLADQFDKFSAGLDQEIAKRYRAAFGK